MNFFDEYSPYRSIVLTLITLGALLLLKKYSTRMIRSYTDPRALKTENVERFIRTWNAAWKFVIGVFVVIALSGSLKLLGLSAAFLGMILGWSLQAPVTGIAAWLMIILKRPFSIGDRVIIAGITGDVTDITLTHVILNQVGGTIGGEERSGRGVLIPNAILFGQVIMNYTLDEKTLLDEVPVRITFDSDYEVAKKIMLEAAKEVMSDVIRDTKQEPFIRAEFFEAGLILRLRYQTIPSRRQEFSSLIVEKILQGIKASYPAVKYCFPQSVVHYRWEDESLTSV
jgi:small-conductance mechanosensitive channel